MAAGHGGQVLVADSTAVLLSGVDLMDLGPRRLRVTETARTSMFATSGNASPETAETPAQTTF
jgi:hypothetical protein